MAQRTWIGGADEVAQVDTFTIDGIGGGFETWTWTITGEKGTTTTIDFVDDGSPTKAEIVAGLVAAWNASTHPFALAVTATDANPDITLTADEAGVPFSVTLAADGTGSTSKASTTVNQGPNDYTTESNWREGSVPVANDDVEITGSSAILYNLDQSGVELDDFIVAPGCSAQIGQAGTPLQIDMGDSDRFEFNGSGAAYLDVQDAAISPVVKRTLAVSQGRAGLHLTGSALATVDVRGGTVKLDGSTVTTLIVAGGATVYVPADATITTLRNLGAKLVELEVAATTVENQKGTLRTSGSGAIGTLNVDGGTVYANSTGTITTLNADGGTVDFRESRESRTVTTLNARGGKAYLDPNVVTVTNAIAAVGPLLVQSA